MACVSVCLSCRLRVCLSARLWPISPPLGLCMSVYPACLHVCLRVCLLSVYLPACLPVYLACPVSMICLCVCVSVLSACLHACMSVHLARLSVCAPYLAACLSVCLCLLACLSVCLSVNMLACGQPVYLVSWYRGSHLLPSLEALHVIPRLNQIGDVFPPRFGVLGEMGRGGEREVRRERKPV